MLIWLEIWNKWLCCKFCGLVHLLFTIDFAGLIFCCAKLSGLNTSRTNQVFYGVNTQKGTETIDVYFLFQLRLVKRLLQPQNYLPESHDFQTRLRLHSKNFTCVIIASILLGHELTIVQIRNVLSMYRYIDASTALLW